MAAFTPSGSGGAPLEVTTTTSGATNPTISNVAMSTAGTEYSYTLPINARQYAIKLRNGAAVLQLAFIENESGTNYDTVPRYCYASDSDLKLTGPLTLYFQSDQNSQVAEIRVWT